MKKRILGLISLVLICAMLCSVFAACNDNGDDDDDKNNNVQDSNDNSKDNSSDKNGGDEALVLDKTKFNIFFGSIFMLKFISRTG